MELTKEKKRCLNLIASLIIYYSIPIILLAIYLSRGNKEAFLTILLLK